MSKREADAWAWLVGCLMSLCLVGWLVLWGIR